MVSLVDIVPQTRTVQLAAGELELRGLGLRQIAELFVAFPSLRNIFTPGAPEVPVVEKIKQTPAAIGTIIAQAAGQPEAAEKIIDVGGGIAPDELFACLDAIVELTFPRGIDPFFQKAMPYLAMIFRDDDDDLTGRDQAMSAPLSPNGSLPPDILLAR